MSGHAVRQEFLPQFRGLSANSRPMAYAVFLFFVAQLLGAIAFGYWLLTLPLTVVSGLGIAAVMFFIGTRLRGFNNIVHECCHYAFSVDRQDNAVIGSLSASIVMGSFRDYRDEHLTHHAHLGDYEKDLDLQGIRHFRLEDDLTPRTVIRHLLTPILGLHLPKYVSVNLSARDGAAYRWFKVALIAAAILFLVYDPLPALLLVWLPFLWIYTGINYWMDCIDHAGLVHSDDELDASRNVNDALPKFVSKILFPRNDGYHLIHHLFPQLPVHHFERCHDLLLENPEYRARNRAQGETKPRKPIKPVTTTAAT